MKYLIIIYTFLQILNVCNCAQAEITEEEKKLWLERFQTGLQQRVSEANVPIDFYGKIIDQNGDPVVGAEIEYGIAGYSVTKVIDVTTGFAISSSEGIFEINNENGEKLFIREIKKKNYTYYVTQNPKSSFDYWAYGSSSRFVPNENEPIVFYVRKQEELAFTLKSDRLMSKDLDFGKVFYGSLKDGRVWPNDHPRFNFQRDFEMVVQRREGQDPLLTITMLGENAGVILSTETVYEAPANGYNSSLEIICEDDEKYVFFMRNKEGLYAKIEGYFSTMEPDHSLVRTDITSWLNPYGDRNLEADSDIPVEIWVQLEKEAKAAFRENKIPEKPNLQQLIGEQ
jgi:hypothetical protein